MTIAQQTTIQAYQLRAGGVRARMSILQMIAADSANNANPSTRVVMGDWRGARRYTMKTYDAAYCKGTYQGKSGEWYTFGDAPVRDERDAYDVTLMTHTGWYTDCSYPEDKAIGIVGSLSHGRFIAGYRLTMNDERVYFGKIFTDEDEAARMADEHARVIAEQESEYADLQRVEMNEE